MHAEGDDIPCCIQEIDDNSHRVRFEDANDESHQMDVQSPEASCSHCNDDGADARRALSVEISEPMRPIGAWATGQCDWNPSGGLTGVRPVVDHYSITRFSVAEWTQRNKDIFDENHRILHVAQKNEYDSRNTTNRTNHMVDHNQEHSTKQLRERTHDVYKWKTTLERAIKANMDEISALAEQRDRLMVALSVLNLPESIATECIERRCRRPDSELIRDAPDEELIEEVALISEIRKVLNGMLKEVNAQQERNRAARQRLEADWSDKKHAYGIESINSSLSNKSTVALFRPGATRYLDEQSTEEHWEHFTKEALVECEESRQKSIKLRSTVDAVLLNAARDLRTKADNVVRAFNKRIAATDDDRIKLEMELTECLKRMADTERLIESLTTNLQNLDTPMKVAQTRLDNRNHRLAVENCRDRAHVGLIDEVKCIGDGVRHMTVALQEAEQTKSSLLNTRGLMEREIMLKRRTIQLDKERCLLIRSHFPSATALSGYT